MYFATSLALAVTGLTTFASAASSTSAAAAASTSSSASNGGCSDAVLAIITSCLGTENPKVQACSGNDWGCLCAAQQQVVQCYTNCPSDPDAFGAQQQETSWCGAAKAYPSSSSSSATSATGTATSAVSGTAGSATSTSAAATSAQTGFASVSGSASGAAASASSTAKSGAMAVQANAGSVGVALVAVMGWALL